CGKEDATWADFDSW
nr:immunoglobulin heavy chain junction region [Macaca mulatta]